MYINVKILEVHSISLIDTVILQLVKQNKFEDMSEILEELSVDLDSLRMRGLIEGIKGKPKDSVFKKIRLTEKGSSILDDIEIPEILEEDLKIYDWLESIYTKSGKDIGNKKKTKTLIAKFRAHSGISKNNLAFLCKAFIEDPAQFEYSIRLEYLFFKPANVFTTKFDIESSRLYQYYLKYKDEFDKKFNTKED
jgi:hypothetical protein